MKKTILQSLKIAGFLALGALLLYFAFRNVAFSDLKEALSGTRFQWIGLSLFFAFLSFHSRARRWQILIEPLGYRPSYWNTYHGLMIGYLSNFALPRMGEVTRCVSLGNREKIPIDALIGTVIVERAIDFLMLLLILGSLFFSPNEYIHEFFRETIIGGFRGKITSALGGMGIFWLIVAACLLVVIFLAWRFRKVLGSFGPVRKIMGILRGIRDGLKTIGRLKRKWEFILHSFLIWFLYIMMTWVVVFAMEVTSSLGFVDGIFLLVVGGLGMSVPVTGGFGAFHIIVSSGLVYVYGLEPADGMAYAILAHESNSLFTILLGIISYVIYMTARKKIRKNSPDFKTG